MTMKITTKRGDKVRFKDIRPGDVFRNEDRDTFIKIGEAEILMGTAATCKINAMCPETGELAVFDDYDVIYKVDAELVIL